jgi:hypothetical protein
MYVHIRIHVGVMYDKRYLPTGFADAICSVMYNTVIETCSMVFWSIIFYKKNIMGEEELVFGV